MVIIIRKKNLHGKLNYKSTKKVLTPNDIDFAHKQDYALNEALIKAEKKLLEDGSLNKRGKKINPLKVWFEIGKALNEYFKNNKIIDDEKKYFWKDLYERETLLHKNLHQNDIAESRNDYKIATWLSSNYSYESLKNIGSWALIREMFANKSITKDVRIASLLINYFVENPCTREVARPKIKLISNRFRFLETSILSDEELLTKFAKAID